MKDEEILAALRALAEADANESAPPVVEARLIDMFRLKNRHVSWPWWIAVAAAVVIMSGAWYFYPRQIARAPQAAIRQPIKVAADFVDVVPAQRPVARTERRRIPREVVTEFFPLMDAPPPLDRAELVRVNVPASAMRMVGLPVREDRLDDRVQADVVVSEEGMAAAIRFVKFQ